MDLGLFLDSPQNVRNFPYPVRIRWIKLSGFLVLYWFLYWRGECIWPPNISIAYATSLEINKLRHIDQTWTQPSSKSNDQMEVIIQLKEELDRTRAKLMAMEQKEKDNEIIRLSYQYEADEMGLQTGRAKNSIVFSWLFH